MRGRQCNAYHHIDRFPVQKSGRLKCAPAYACLLARFLRAFRCTLGQWFAVPALVQQPPLPASAGREAASPRAQGMQAAQAQLEGAWGGARGGAQARAHAEPCQRARGACRAQPGSAPAPRKAVCERAAWALAREPAPQAAAAEQATRDHGAARAGAPLLPGAGWGLATDGPFCLAADPHAAGPDAWAAGVLRHYSEDGCGTAEWRPADDLFRAASRGRATGAASPSASAVRIFGEPDTGSAGGWASPVRVSSLLDPDDVPAWLLEASPSITQATRDEGPDGWDARPACNARLAGVRAGAAHAPAARPAAARAAAAENAGGAADSEYLTRILTALQRCSDFDDGYTRSHPMLVEGIALSDY